MPDCLQVNVRTVAEYDWLPPTCAYRLRYLGQPLPEWHPLVSGDPATVRLAGVSVAGRVVGEDDAPDLPWVDFIVDWPGQWPPASRPLARRGPIFSNISSIEISFLSICWDLNISDTQMDKIGSATSSGFLHSSRS
ncbi:MAG: hypothetical protein R6U40_06795 [Desulfobacterales bacterium]